MSCRKLVQPHGDVPLLSTVPTSRPLVPKLWRLFIFFLSYSAFSRTQSYQFCSTSVLTQVFCFYQRLAAFYLSHYGALPISTLPSMTLVIFVSPKSSSTNGHTRLLYFAAVWRNLPFEPLYDRSLCSSLSFDASSTSVF